MVPLYWVTVPFLEEEFQVSFQNVGPAFPFSTNHSSRVCVLRRLLFIRVWWTYGLIPISFKEECVVNRMS